MALHSTVTHPAPRWGAPKHYGTFLALLIGGVLTIAAVAIAAIVITSNDEASVGTTGVITGEAGRPFVISNPVPVFYYLVATQEEADRFTMSVNQDEWAAAAAGMQLEPMVTIFLAIDSPEREAMLQVMLQELNYAAQETGFVTQVIDLRTAQ